MDTLTQAVLGAAVGQAGFSRRLGRKAAWWGALGGVLPDLDVLARVFAGQWASLEWHRGPTHALWFGPVVGTLIGYGMWRWYRRRTGSDPAGPGGDSALPAWIGLWVLALFTHPLLDVFTTYGTQLLSPFSNHRFALDGVAIIDPLYTVPLVAALLVGRFSRRRPGRGARAAGLALVLTTGYLGYGVWVNEQARDEARRQAAAAGLEAERVDAYPTLFQPWLRRVVAWETGAVHVGQLSTWAPHTIRWAAHRFPADPRVDQLRETAEGRLFTWFSNQSLAGFVREDGPEVIVRLGDMRYGFPGQALPLWGVEQRFRGQDAVGPPDRFRAGTPPVGPTLRGLWRATFTPGDRR